MRGAKIRSAGAAMGLYVFLVIVCSEFTPKFHAATVSATATFVEVLRHARRETGENLPWNRIVADALVGSPVDNLFEK
jgi:hypothetical protein